MDALLTCRIKIGIVGSAKVLALGVLPKLFLMIVFHAVNIFLCIVLHAGVVAVGANDEVLVILELRLWVRTAAAVACAETSTAPLASVSSS